MAQQPKPKPQPRRTLGIKVPPEVIPAQTEEEGVDIRKTFAAIDAVFNGLGTDNAPETKLPVSPHRNNADVVADYVLAEHLKKMAEDRFKQAKERAEKTGVFGSEEDYIEGQTVQVWQSPHYSLLVKKGKASTMIDKDKVLEVLMRRLGHDKAQEAFEECMKPRAGAQSIIVSIK